MSVISVNRSASFNELKELMDLTDGNLASHMKKLEELKYITVHKSFFGRKPNTVYKITTEGKAAFDLVDGCTTTDNPDGDVLLTWS